MRDRVPEMEYVFCDTGAELRETYAYLDKLEAYLGKKIVRLNSGKSFDYWLSVHSGYLPSPRARWCTKTMKIEPYEKYVGDDNVISYIGIRADENREGYISSKGTITPVYPFKEDGITKDDVFRILEESGLGYPEYYKWRSRSGCYFCFFQQKNEWVGLLENHPDLFEESKKYEKFDPKIGRSFTWVQGRTLGDVEKDKVRILERHQKALADKAKRRKPKSLMEQFSTRPVLAEDDNEEGCLVCHL